MTGNQKPDYSGFFSAPPRFALSRGWRESVVEHEEREERLALDVQGEFALCALADKWGLSISPFTMKLCRPVYLTFCQELEWQTLGRGLAARSPSFFTTAFGAGALAVRSDVQAVGMPQCPADCRLRN